MARFETMKIGAATTDGGEHAPEIAVVREYGTFYLHQFHPGEKPSVATVGMSREQASLVRNALSSLLGQS